jgi:hypothetical protein
MRYIPLALLTLAAVSCSNDQSTAQVSLFHEDGRAKPTVAVAAMLDTTSFDVSWSVSEELTDGISNQLARTGQIIVHNQEESPFTDNPFSADLSWMKREFQGHEFVAFLELVEHEFAPVKTTADQEGSSNLNAAVRVRVVDLRGATPKIVLQEMVKNSYFVPKTLIPNDYSIETWGTDAYQKSPMGVAHAILVNEISSRISDYILLAKSR